MEDRLLEDLKQAMKSGNDIEKNTIQFLRAQILKAKKDKCGDLSDTEIENIIVQERKKRYEALVLFEKGNRKDLMEKTYKELACINKYLPKVLTETELQNELVKIIEELNADKSMFGKVMGTAKAKLGNRADGKMVSELVKKLLGV